VDATVPGIGRRIPVLQRIADLTELNIIVATGWYTFDTLPVYLQSRGPGTLLGGPEPLVEMFVRDIEHGVANTGVRAGFLKCTAGAAEMTPGVERVLRAVAEAHVVTGVPVMVHTDAHTRQGLNVQALLGAAGVDLSQVVIAHSGDTTDVEYLRTLMDAGSYVGMDRFGTGSFGSMMPGLKTEERVSTVVRLCEFGYASRMVLSHDYACWTNLIPSAWTHEHWPDFRLTFLFDEVLPMLRDRGVAEPQIQQILVVNPRDLFGGTRS
jgi:phosphotriesterase-related protein